MHTHALGTELPPWSHSSPLCPPRLEDIYGCPYDFIEVFDGREMAPLSMGRYCAGMELTFYSSSNLLTAIFRSDAMITNTGFFALYNTVKQDERESGGCPPQGQGHPSPLSLMEE